MVVSRKYSGRTLVTMLSLLLVLFLISWNSCKVDAVKPIKTRHNKHPHERKELDVFEQLTTEFWMKNEMKIMEEDQIFDSMYYHPVTRHLLQEKTRGCIGPLYGNINWNVVAGWIEYYEQRWGMTAVDIFVQTEDGTEISKLKLEFDAIGTEPQSMLNFTNIPLKEPSTGYDINFKFNMIKRDMYHKWVHNQCLFNSRFFKDDYLLAIDPDEFLVSDDFETLADMFKYTGTDAISFPVFQNNYHRCSSVDPTFGSASYHAIVPISSSRTVVRGVPSYTDPDFGAGGIRKYILKPSQFGLVMGVHDVLGDEFDGPFDEERVYYISGRKQDKEHARLYHYETDKGLHEDLTVQMCSAASFLKGCDYITEAGDCVTNELEADYENIQTSVNEILFSLELSPKVGNFVRGAVCYAERYSDLHDGFCGGDSKFCNVQGLRGHFSKDGKTIGMKWGCSNEDVALTQARAVCYAERHPDLLEGFCKGDKTKCDYEGLEAHYRTSGKEWGLLWGCQDDIDKLQKEAVCYAERYKDLHDGFCGGDSTKCDFSGLLSHFNQNGDKFSLIWGCKVEVHAVCYARRYPDLLAAFCNGGNEKECNVEGLWEHFKQFGKAEKMVWGCRPGY